MTAYKVRVEEFEAEDVRAFYDSHAFRVWHLAGKERTYKIVRVQRISEEFMKETKRKALLTLALPNGKAVPLPLALNPTNRNTIMKLYGNAPRGWIGKLITLYPTDCDSPQGRVDCIRVRPYVPGAQQDGTRRNRQGVNVVPRQLPERANVAEAEFVEQREHADVTEDTDEPPPGALESDHAGE